MRVWVMILGLVVVCAGCTRAWYRRSADRETYAIVQEHMDDPRWLLPRIDIDTPPQSRLYDPFNPDRPPWPPDDPAAARYMVGADSLLGCNRWDRDGVATFIEDSAWQAFLPLEATSLLLLLEDPVWQAFLPLEPTRALRLTPERSVEIALLNSREYQTELEDLYLIALQLSFERFEFDTQWFFRNATFYDHFGSSSLPGESNTLSTSTTAGFTRAFASGGELLVSLANSFVWEYTSKDTNTVSTNIFASFVQPLLRQAGRRVRLEALTQAERDVLYAVRDFARFRKEFSVDLTTGAGGYLTLLLQVQSIRNQQANLQSLEQNLRLHDALLDLGSVSVVQYDQALQSYQSGRLQLLREETRLEESLDRYKIQLGLPPTIPVLLDDALLQPFQLTDPALTALQDDLEKFNSEVRQPDLAPPIDKLRNDYRRLLRFHERTVQIHKELMGELERWRQLPPPPDEPEENLRRERLFQQSLERQLAALKTELDDLHKDVTRKRDTAHWFTRHTDWEDLQKQIRQEITAAAQLFVIQNQIRVYLIRIRPIKLETDAAIQYALEERFDLMNQRGRVTDAWRKIEVAANALQSDLDVRVEADIRTAADASNPFDFAASNSRYRVGFEFDGPLNRLRERNIYRASLVNYQRARRDFMAREDQIRQEIRRDLRQLQTERLNFEIVRQTLITAAREVESTRERLLIPERGQQQDTSSTRDTLDALRRLLEAKNALIASWVSYQSFRIQLLLNLEALQLDERGLYRDDQDIDLRRPGRDFPGPFQPGHP